MRGRLRIALRGYRPDERGVGSVLGDLETAVMEALWAKPSRTVIEVERVLQRRRDVAHTTVLTTLDRLHRKGYLTRIKRGRAFVYSPRFSREQFERGLVEEVLGSLLGNLGAPALSAFVDLVGEDLATLDRLEAIIREKRRTRREATGDA